MLESLSHTQLFATFFGLYMLAAGIGLLTERDGYLTLIDDLRENTALGFVLGVFVFTIGAMIVTLHNLWTGPLAIFVTLIGWAALIEGLLLLAFRRPFLRLVGFVKFTPSTIVPFGVFALLLGVVLIYAALG